MPAPDLSTGAPCWIDLMSDDIARCRDFYCELFGWEAEDPQEEFGGYFNFTKDGVRIAGGMAKHQAEHPNVWSVYLVTADAKQTIDEAVTRGSQVIVPAMDVGTLGTMGVVTDPGGAVIGMWKQGEHKGFGVVREHGTPGWFELHTRDHAASLDFYREVFGWTTETVGDTEEFRYTVLKHGDEQLAGVMDASAFLPDGVPAHWSVYFAVDDTDAALTHIEKLGGSVVMPAEDTPYGRLAIAADPTGTIFKLVGPNDAMPATG